MDDGLSILIDKAKRDLGDRWQGHENYDPKRHPHHPRIGTAHGFQVHFERSLFPASATSERNPLAPAPWYVRLGEALFGWV